MNVGIAKAKAKLSELVDRVIAGEEVVIERHGKPVARITAEQPKKKPLDIEAIEELRKSMPADTGIAGETVRQMRDDARY